MGLKISVEPTIEPVTLAEAKAQCRLDTGTFADTLTPTISIAPDAWPITASYGIVGTGVSVLNKNALIQLSVGTVATGATLDYKMQESDALGSGYVDVSGETYTQITAAGTYEKAYTGIKAYVRVVATVAVGAIDFGASVITGNYQVTDDTYISGLITDARIFCEGFQNRAYITRTYEYTLDAWPGNVIELPCPPLIAVSSIVYYDTANTATTWSSAEYQVDATGFIGRICPAYGYDWPSTTLRTMAGIKITYTAGYGATAASVPSNFKRAILLIVGDMYENRENSDIVKKYDVPISAQRLLYFDKDIRV